ncbi:MAG: AGE family epimerase/isomerase [Candidatus Binatia bacterium]
MENIIPFWYPRILDTKDGGYRLNHDREGKWRGPANKCLVTQARTVWFFSRLVNSCYGNSEHLNAARHGYDFLYSRMWDSEFGGFYWEVEAARPIATKPDKHLYGQAFGLFALTEYAKASGDSTAAAAARDLFNLVESHAHDVRYGGYRECFQRDWKALQHEGYLGTPSTIKLMNTHLHLMEALVQYYLLTHDSRARERLIELIFVNSNSVVHKNLGACTDKYLEDWQPLRGPNHDRVSYGHDVENVRLLAEACRSAAVPNSLFLDLYTTVFSYALRFGYDHRHGGFYDSGPFDAPADRHEKIWWVQAEGLTTALQMYRLTGQEIYWNCFSRTLDWIVNHQADWDHGDWYQSINPNGKPSGVKAGPWKSPYHNGRAMLQCLDLLAEECDQRFHEALA